MPFGAAYVAAEAADQAFAGIGGVDHVRRWRLRGILERIGAAGDFVDRNVWPTERRKAVGDERIVFIGRVVAGADIEGERKRVVADIGRVVAGGASSLKRRDGYGGAERCGERGVIGEAADIRDGKRARIEERLSGGDFAAQRVGEFSQAAKSVKAVELKGWPGDRRRANRWCRDNRIAARGLPGPPEAPAKFSQPARKSSVCAV